MPAKIKDGSRVRQIVKPIEGFVTRKELVGDDILVFVQDEADGHEKVLHEDHLEVLQEPSNDQPA
jgi:hypothetical protein